MWQRLGLGRERKRGGPPNLEGKESDVSVRGKGEWWERESGGEGLTVLHVGKWIGREEADIRGSFK